MNSPHPILSIIIPTLNEAEHLPALLDDLKSQENIHFEIIVGDGGSSDATRAIAEKYGPVFVKAERGRGVQMNTAAAQASGEYLLFLHADSRIDNQKLLSNAIHGMTEARQKTPDVAGHFRLQFIRSSNRNDMAYRYAEGKTAFNRVNTTNGDQGLLISRDFFSRIGGFDENLPFLEDQRIAEKIRVQGNWITLPGYLKTSARRFETEGFRRRYILMSMMMGLHSVGIEEFFTRAPGVYKAQQNTGKLFLSPFFGLIWRMMCEDWGFRGSVRTYYLLGRYIRQNSWQLFYFMDVWFQPVTGVAHYPLLRFHDRIIAPCTNFPVFNALTGLLCFLWFMGVLAPFFWIIDYREMNCFMKKEAA